MSWYTHANPFDGTTKWIWSSEGIAGPRPDTGRYRIRHFRRVFDAPTNARLIIHVSADSRYRLWCNGREAAFGPAKGDIEHHFFETVDVSSLLCNGRNVLAATVEYYGDCWSETTCGAPCSRMTARPGFVMRGTVVGPDEKPLEDVHTDRRWRVLVDRSLQYQDDGIYTNWIGGSEHLDCALFPWDFQVRDYDDSAWPEATETVPAVSDTWHQWAVSPHRLVPRMIAPLEMSEPRRFTDIISKALENDAADWQHLIAGMGTVTIPAHSSLTVIVDAGAETTGYPRIVFSGGAGAQLGLRGAEMLRQSAPDGSVTLDGYCDIVIPDGPQHTYTPFTWRTFRFIAVEVTTAAQPLHIEAFDYRFSAYPFVERGCFESSDPDHARIWEISWRTARLCAHETYEDCPYYEQLQYGGDTQVQAMISYYVAGDPSLARQFLYQYDWSRTSNGLTRSRYPARVPQTIPFWSHHWVMSVYDYWRHTGDMKTVNDLLPGVLAVMEYFNRRITSDGIVGTLDGWLCADWCPQWTDEIDGNGVPPGTRRGQSAFVSLISAAALSNTIELVKAAGAPATHLRSRLRALKEAAHRMFFDSARGLYRDLPDGQLASAYTNVWAILADMPCDHSVLANHIVSDRSLCQLTMFSTYFAYRALAKAGCYELAPALLMPWRRMLEAGLTTCPEIPDFTRTRSFCHAWSAAPPVEFLREILGVYPAEPGYTVIGIAPKTCGLAFARGRVPLPNESNGSERYVDVAWRIEDSDFHIEVNAPEGVPCILRMPNKTLRRHANGGCFSHSTPL